jgi:hypothetical protein
MQPATHNFDATSTLSVALKDGRLSIGAKQASWQELLKQIQDKTGIPIHCAIPLQGSVTVRCAYRLNCSIPLNPFAFPFPWAYPPTIIFPVDKSRELGRSWLVR